MLRRKVRRVVFTTLAWIVVGALIGVYDHLAYLMFEGAAPYSFPLALSTSIVGALVGGGLGAWITVFVLKPRQRKHSFARIVATDTVVYTGLILAMTVLLTFFFQASLAQAPPLSRQVRAASVAYLLGAGPAKFLMVWIVVAGVTAVAHAVSDHFGPSLFRSFVFGRYKKPRVENRTFMFLDLVGSTTIAERLGHVRYFELLQSLFDDLTEPLLATNASVYQYVGDEVVLTWPADGRSGGDASVACFFAIEELLSQKEDEYEREFGAVPRFRAGVHSGRVTTGQVGQVRTDIVHSGDVLNTAARIQGRAKEAEAAVLVSGEVAYRLPGSKWVTESLGDLALKGKSERVMVFAVQPLKPHP